MSISVVINQMCVMLLIILTGYLLYKKGMLSELSSRHISGLVVNVCNPAALLAAALDDGPRVPSSQLVYAFLITLLMYAFLLLAGWLLPLVMRIPRDRRYIYHFLTVYGNVGFLGIPLVSAVLGGGALIYVSINCLVYNLLFYITGAGQISRKAEEAANRTVCPDSLSSSQTSAVSPAIHSGLRNLLSRLINVGTISAILSLLLYVGSFRLPMILSDTIIHAGKAATLLSMLVLGVSVAQMPLRELFIHREAYLFALLRLLVIPITGVLLLHQFVSDPLLLGTCALLFAVPCGNLPLMCAREHGLPSDEMARTIVFATILSVVTIPVVVLFL